MIKPTNPPVYVTLKMLNPKSVWTSNHPPLVYVTMMVNPEPLWLRPLQPQHPTIKEKINKREEEKSEERQIKPYPSKTP